MNRPPFTYYTLYIPPFGVVPFENIGYEKANVGFTITVDLITGTAMLTNLSGDGKHTKMATGIGVNVPLVQINDNYFERAGNMAVQLASAVGSALTGNIAGAIAGGASAIGTVSSSWENAVPIGSCGGNFTTYMEKAYLQAMYMDVVDENVNNLGRPLCASRKISDFTGYVKCGEGYTKISGTAEEYDQVNRMMREGFYYA